MEQYLPREQRHGKTWQRLSPGTRWILIAIGLLAALLLVWHFVAGWLSDAPASRSCVSSLLTRCFAATDCENDDEDDDKPEKLGYADDESDDGDVKMADPIRGAAPRGTGKRADARSQTQAQEAAQRKELEAMMDSDDDGDVQVVEPSGASNAKATGQGKDLDPDVEMADSTVTDTMQGSASVPAAAKRRVRKKRKIGSKKVRTKDERGYTVTKTVDEYESYSSEESDAPVVLGSKRGGGATKSQPKPAAESRSTSTSASASPAPSAPAKAASASNSTASRKPSGGATPTPANPSSCTP